MQIEKCRGKDAKYIDNKLAEYNLSKVPATQKEPFLDLSRKLVEDGRIVGGVIATMYCWNIVYVETLWVDAVYRDQKYGSELLRMVEREARDLGGTLIHLDTFDFQALEFYQKMGYTIFGVLENCPDGHCRYYLKKSL